VHKVDDEDGDVAEGGPPRPKVSERFVPCRVCEEGVSAGETRASK
jgi:hypothetical protein